MAKITKIEQQKKRKDRYSVFIDGEYSFALPEAELVAANIQKGQQLTAEQHKSLIELSSSSKTYDQAINYLSFRPRSVKEVKDHLHGKGLAKEEIEPVIARLLKHKFLDDRSFANSWIESRRLLKPTSKRKLVIELRAKGVSSEIIEEVLAGIDPLEEVEAIKKLARRKLALARFQDQRKLTDYLIRQGFPYDQVKSALQELD